MLIILFSPIELTHLSIGEIQHNKEHEHKYDDMFIEHIAKYHSTKYIVDLRISAWRSF